MDRQRLDALTVRAEKAKELADALAKLEASDPTKNGLSYSLTRKDSFGQPQDVLAIHLLREVLIAGRAAVIQEKERELEKLLGVEPQPPSSTLGIESLSDVSTQNIELAS